MNGSYSYVPQIWPSIITTVLLLSLSVYSWRRRSVPGALPFAIGCLFTGLSMAGSVMEYLADDIATKISWFNFGTIWQLPAASAITCFILEYVWPGRWLNRRNLALLSIVPLLCVVLILTNDRYHLAWRNFVFERSLISEPAPIAWFFLAFGYGLGIVNLFVLIWLFVRSPQHRLPVAIIITGQIAARTVFLLDAANIFHSDLPLDILGIGFVFLMYAIVLFRFHIFDPIHLARRSAIEQLNTGMLVLDPQGRIVSLNPAAEQILGAPASSMKGKLIRKLLPAYPDGPFSDTVEIETELRLPKRSLDGGGAGQDVRYYNLAISLLKDWRGLEVGRLLLLHDVTEQKLAQAQIISQQRALAMLNERARLARELHDSLGQVFAFVNVQGQTIRRLLARADISKADEYVARLVEVAQEADVDIRESILGLRMTLSEKGFFPALEQYLERYEKNHEIHTKLDRPETPGEMIFEPQVEVQLLRILQEALTNIRKHANARCVRVIITPQNGYAQVTITDDGRGFESQEFSSGLGERVGLRVMRERAEDVGGCFTIQSKPGEGTRVVITVPLRQDRLGIEKTI